MAFGSSHRSRSQAGQVFATIKPRSGPAARIGQFRSQGHEADAGAPTAVRALSSAIAAQQP